jgi:ABC-type multidrug transport system fused ATPase/permease subunit
VLEALPNTTRFNTPTPDFPEPPRIVLNFCQQDEEGAKEFKLGDCALEFDDVSFSYSPTAPVLRNVSFKLEGGKTLALVGPTGSGKSTALRLLFRSEVVSNDHVETRMGAEERRKGKRKRKILKT